MQEFLHKITLALYGKYDFKALKAHYAELYGTCESMNNLDDLIYTVLTSLKINYFRTVLLKNRFVESFGTDAEIKCYIGVPYGDCKRYEVADIVYYGFGERFYVEGSSRPIWIEDARISEADYLALCDGYGVPSILNYYDYLLSYYNIGVRDEKVKSALGRWLGCSGLDVLVLFTRYTSSIVLSVDVAKVCKLARIDKYICVGSIVYKLSEVPYELPETCLDIQDEMYEVSIGSSFGYILYKYDMFYFGGEMCRIERVDDPAIKRKFLLA